MWSLRLKEFFSYSFYPLGYIQNQFVNPFKKWLAYHPNEQIIAHMKAHNDELQAQVARLQAEQGYVQDTKELRDFRLRYQTNNALLTQILVRHISPQMHWVILDAGETKGVKKNMVAVYKEHLLGRIIEVYPYYSKLLLITDRTCKVSAYCATTKATGIHEGVNSLEAASLAHMSHLAYVESGDLILSTGEGLIFPRGFALGRVTAFIKKDLFYEITTQPLIDIRAISYCYLIQKGNDTMIHGEDSIEINRANSVKTYTNKE